MPGAGSQKEAYRLAMCSAAAAMFMYVVPRECFRSLCWAPSSLYSVQEEVGTSDKAVIG